MSQVTEFSQLHWVVVHSRGVLHTGASTDIVKILATAAMLEGKDSLYYMRYDDSPERDLIPMMQYAVIGTPKIEILPPEELEPVGEIFDVLMVLDSSMVAQKTSQRALLFDGAKPQAVLVVNSTLPPEALLDFVRKYVFSRWKGRLVAMPARRYDSNLAIGMVGGLVKAWNVVSMDSAVTALESLGMADKAKGLQRAFQEATAVSVI